MIQKNDISRENLKDNIMKMIIFRLDYQGMIDSTDFVKIFKEKFSKSFSDYCKNAQSSVDLEITNVEDISNTLSIPISEIQRQDVHRFTGNTFGTDKLTLDISVYSSVLQIECINYVNLNPYIDFITSYINLLMETNEYLSLKRFGLRKIGSNVYFDFNEIHKDFEINIFKFDKQIEGNFSLVRNRVEEVLLQDDLELKINFVRYLDTGFYFDPQTSEEKKAYQVTLDLDAYLDETSLLKNNYRSDLIKLIPEINNKYLFNLFKLSVTEDFLNNNLVNYEQY
jgi:hypothetical protein